MAVYIVPRDRYYGGFWGSLGQGAAGLVTNLLGSQLNAMIERGNEARKVRQYDKFLQQRDANLASMGVDRLSANRQQSELASLYSPHYVLQTDDTRNRWGTNEANTEQTRGQEQQWGALRNVLGRDAADTIIGGQRAGTDTSIQRELFDIVAPTYNANVIDQGDRTTLSYTNPRDPRDSFKRVFDKNLSPQDLLNADLTLKGLDSALEQTKQKGIVSRLTSRDSDLKHLVAQRESIVKELESGNIEQGSPVHRRRMADLAAIDARLGEYYGYTHLIPQAELEVEMPTASQMNKEAKKLMDDERALGNDVSMEQALRTVRKKYGIE